MSVKNPTREERRAATGHRLGRFARRRAAATAREAAVVEQRAWWHSAWSQVTALFRSRTADRMSVGARRLERERETTGRPWFRLRNTNLYVDADRLVSGDPEVWLVRHTGAQVGLRYVKGLPYTDPAKRRRKLAAAGRRVKGGEPS